MVMEKQTTGVLKRIQKKGKEKKREARYSGARL